MIDKHIDAARRRLAHLQGLSDQTHGTEKRIRDAAADRLGHVEESIAKLRPRVHTDPQAAEKYQALIAERGTLETVLAASRQHIGDEK